MFPCLSSVIVTTLFCDNPSLDVSSENLGLPRKSSFSAIAVLGIGARQRTANIIERIFIFSLFSANLTIFLLSVTVLKRENADLHIIEISLEYIVTKVILLYGL